jgi:hypothetical protein
MTVLEVPGTYAHQLNKPSNRKVLDAFQKNKKDTIEDFINLFLWLTKTLRPTPAWNKPKTNIKLREIKGKLEATLAKAKSGKSSAHAVANDLINTIKHCATLNINATSAAQLNPGVPADLDQFEAELQELLVTGLATIK